ncbi:MAG TPA: hypothetical protein PK014_06260 [Thermoanaerobaculia bacterium]|mgnify:CR=1 FL=1|nr:hypothetical protein [Thermoanaerobaculia bacterium]HUM29355.1 hypothetical protein [Thermoanaerobaculia bacterium]HXK67601.1 hypothetical protein [Thermoanaerobaculia bacterium]
MPECTEIHLPILAFVVTEDSVNTVIKENHLPFRVILEKERLILAYEGEDHQGGATFQVFFSALELHYPEIHATIDRVTAMHRLPVPRSALHLVTRRYPFLSFKENNLVIHLESLIPDGISCQSGSFEIDWGLLSITVTDLRVSTRLIRAASSENP